MVAIRRAAPATSTRPRQPRWSRAAAEARRHDSTAPLALMAAIAVSIGSRCAVLAVAAAGAEPARGVAHLDQRLPLAAAQRRHPRLAPPGERLGDVTVAQGVVGTP